MPIRGGAMPPPTRRRRSESKTRSRPAFLLSKKASDQMSAAAETKTVNTPLASRLGITLKAGSPAMILKSSE
jgi:hypothetical protein